MRLIYKYYWIFHILAFLLPLIGLPLPVAIFKVPDNGSYIIDGSITLWSTRYGIFPNTFKFNEFISIVSYVCSWIVVISSFIIPVLASRSIRKKKKLEKSILISWIFIASLFVGITLYWTIMLNNTIGTVMSPALQDTNFWDYFSPGFGFFSLLTSAGFVIIGAIMYWKRRSEEAIISMRIVEAPRVKLTIQEKEKFEFKEDLEKGAFWMTFTFMIILTFWILITIVTLLYPKMTPLIAILLLSILWGGFFIILRKASKFMRGATKIRTLTITEDTIMIQFPDKPIFQVNWESFDKIQINERYETLPTIGMHGRGPKIYYYVLSFEKNSNFLTSFEVSLLKLKFKTLTAFLYKLHICALKKKKIVINNTDRISLNIFNIDNSFYSD